MTSKRLEQGFAVTGKAREAGKKGAASRKRLMAERKARGEKQWDGGFKKGDPITLLRSKLAIQERWRRYYEERAKELEALTESLVPDDVDERFQEAKRNYEAIVSKVKSSEKTVSMLLQKIEIAEKIESKIVFGTPSSYDETNEAASKDQKDQA